MTKGIVSALIAAAVLCVACDRGGKQPADGPAAVGTSGRKTVTVTEALRAEAPPVFVPRDAEGTRLWKLTRQFYQNRGDQPAWIENQKPRGQMDELIGELRNASREGLDPALYNVETLSARRQEAGRGFLTAKGFDPAEAAKLDVWLTYLYLQYASDLTAGLVDLSHADPNWKMRDRQEDVLALLTKAIDEDRVGKSLQELTPRHPQYTMLR